MCIDESFSSILSVTVKFSLATYLHMSGYIEYLKCSKLYLYQYRISTRHFYYQGQAFSHKTD